jgi:hypothetical protein
VVALLDSVFDDQFLVMAARAEQEGSSRGDPALGNTLAAMAADIKRAWSGLSDWDRQMLEAKHKYELGLDVIAFLAGIEGAHEAAQHIDAAMERMLQSLNRFTYIERVDAG